VNVEHFRAFLWLRWRLLINQLRRGGIANVVILALFAVGAVTLAIGAFVAFFLVGVFALRDESPTVILYVWDGLVVAFLFAWCMGLMIELQRSEVLSLDKVLHLPVSLRGAFLINYVSSLFSVPLMVFLPGMLALSLGLAIARGPLLLLVLPLVAAFLLMVTALTYQFQGWLASLMANKRRRRTVIVLVTAAFILLCQLPNLVNLFRPWDHQAANVPPPPTTEKQWEYLADVRVAEQKTQQLKEYIFHLLNLFLPPGWLPLGAEAAAKGDPLPALLGTLGLGSIGAFSLWRAYRTTLRLYTGAFNSGKRAPVVVAAAVAAPTKTGTPSVGLLEWKLPWVSDAASAIALSGFRSLVRAPEVKMLLLTPLILVLVFGSLFFMKTIELLEVVRPLVAFAAMSLILVTMTQLLGNQFGFDRGGFRVFVLSAVPRRDILLGKNLAVAPLALGLSAVLITALQVMFPMRVDHLLAVVPQFVGMYLLFCLVANFLSIFTPMPVRSGTLKPVNPKGMALLVQVVLLFLYPLTLMPMLLPYGVEVALDEFGRIHGVPICLMLCVVECAVIVFVYWLVVAKQGEWLQFRELKILEIVTSKTE